MITLPELPRLHLLVMLVFLGPAVHSPVHWICGLTARVHESRLIPMFACLFVRLFVCLFVRLCVCAFVRLFVRLFVLPLVVVVVVVVVVVAVAVAVVVVVVVVRDRRTLLNSYLLFST